MSLLRGHEVDHQLKSSLALSFVQPLIADHIAFGTGVTSRRCHRASA